MIWSSTKNQGKRREKDKRKGKRKGEERFVQKVQRVRPSKEMKGGKGALTRKKAWEVLNTERKKEKLNRELTAE